jgi:hypothetical protein
MDFSQFIEVSFGLLAQITGDRGGIDHHIVPFVMTAMLWIFLLGLAQRKQEHLYHEKLLIWGFSVGLGRELFMILMAALNAYKVFDHELLHAAFPPFEHMLSNFAEVVVAAAFLRYLLEDSQLSKRYLQSNSNPLSKGNFREVVKFVFTSWIVRTAWE